MWLCIQESELLTQLLAYLEWKVNESKQYNDESRLRIRNSSKCRCRRIWISVRTLHLCITHQLYTHKGHYLNETLWMLTAERNSIASFYVVGQLNSRTRHGVLVVAALDKNLSMVWWRWHISVSQLCCCWSMAVSLWVASIIVCVCFSVPPRECRSSN